MHTTSRLQVGINSLERAKIYLHERNYGRAFAHYLVYFQLVEDGRGDHEKEFANTLAIWGKVLEQNNRVEDLCKCYLQGLNYFPSNTKILNNFGAALMRMDEFEAAKKYLQKAHILQPNSLQIEKNLITAKGTLVERWHFPMLNDYERNKAYYKAILAYSANNNAHAIDIGTGCGLLTLFASNNDNITRINAIECSKIICKIAEKVFEENNILKVKLHNQHSTEMSENDINGRGNLLITEIFDIGLFGEQALETLIHAWENLLEEDATVIPASASLYVTGIESFEISKKNTVILSEIEIEDLKIDDGYLNLSTDAPYECINLKGTKYRVLTETKKVLDVNFSNLTQLKELQSKQNYFDSISLTVVNSGCLHGFAMWFDLHIDANNIITTDPNQDSVKCWEQGVKFVNYPFPCDEGTKVDIKMEFIDGKIEMNLINENLTTHEKCFYVSNAMISFLNDQSVISTLEKLYDCKVKNKIILDTNEFPVLGFKYAKNNNRCMCTYSTEEDKLFIEHIRDINGISPENLVLMRERDLNSCVSARKHLFDIVILDLIKKNGTVKENAFLNYNIMESNLSPTGVIYPKRLELLCEVIESDYLRSFNTVQDENLCGFKIGSHMNEYAVNEHFYLDKNFQHKKLSEPVDMGNVLIKDLHQSVTTRMSCALQPGNITDAILYWFKLVFNDEVEIDTRSASRYDYGCFLIDRNYEQEFSEITVCLQKYEGIIKLYCENYPFCFIFIPAKIIIISSNK